MRSLLPLLVGPMLIACAPRAATQVDIVVEADEAIRDEAVSLAIEVEGRGEGGGDTRTFDEVARFPLTVAIVPRGGDPRRTFSFSVTALDAADAPIVATRLTSGFVSNARGTVTVWLRGICRGVECPPLQTCRDGACVDSMIELTPDAGPPLGDDASDLDGGARDTGTEAPVDARDPRDAFEDPCAACDDGLACNGRETCTAGRCEPGSGPSCIPRACDESASCVEPSGACARTPADADEDGFGDASCGGDDCDDARAEAHPFADEICDGRDEDCDRRVDEDTACPPGQACTLRSGSAACRTPVCGDGFLESPELCDHAGMASRPDGCGPGCTFDDTCGAAIDLDVVGTRTATRISYRFSTVGASSRRALSCAGIDGPDRVFSVLAPASSLTAHVTNNNTAIEAYRGLECTTAIGCDDDADGVRPRLSLTGLTPGEPITFVVDQLVAAWGSTHDLQIDFP